MKVRKIEWLEGENELTLHAEVLNGIFSYESKIILPSNSLNAVLSRIQKDNQEVEVNDCMVVEQWSQNQSNYVFNFEANLEALPLLSTQDLSGNYRQIRA